MTTSIRLRLSVMMFLQYFIWSCWYVTMGPYLAGTLNFTGQQIGFAYNSTALAAMLSPFFVGMIADRFFATEKMLAALHTVGGLFMLAAAQAKSFGAFYPLLLGHTLCYMPTLALTNSISFSRMSDPGMEFPRIRVLGTISWICAALAIGLLGGRELTTPIPFMIAGVFSLLMGGYCLTLPHTPPKGSGPVTARDVLGLDALRLLREKSFLIFVIAAFLLCIPLTFYFSFTPAFLGDLSVQRIPWKMSLGQMSEILFMLVMPLFFVRLGVKWMLFVGMLCWSVRYGLFILGYNTAALWPLYLGILLHGICYDFFFVTAYIYVDKKAPEAIRAKAQGFITFVMLGLGMFVGANLSGVVVEHYSFPNVVPDKIQAVADPGVWSPGSYVAWQADGERAFGKISEIQKDAGTAAIEVFRRVDSRFEPGAEIVTQPLTALARPLPHWNSIWLLPALGAFAILTLFAILFQYREATVPT